MTEVIVRVGNKNGIHMRPAMVISDIANTFKSNIRIESEHYKANAKSIVDMAMLVAAHDTLLTIQAEGTDENDAIEKISYLIEKKDEEYS
ncbi:MAG: HPr family phosphocarrier protein [Clostridiales bacterium]|nr:HPr family phosphocarrier protein [Clostridiales bacterium]